jgi:GR25 family glycosyltransferase involved in LPS biosynthesis
MPALQARLKPTFNEVFEQVVVINLAKRPDRMAQIKAQLDAHKITFERFEAIDAQELSITGVAACALSHRAVIEKYKDCQSVFIFEDDAELDPNFKQLWDVFITNLPDDWQMLYLGCNRIESNLVANGVGRLLQGITSHAYGAKQSVFDSMIDASKRAEAIDLSYMQLQVSVPTYVAVPTMVGQVPGFSDIEQRFTDYTYILR